MKQFRIIATSLDGAGAPIPVTWYGEAISPKQAVENMKTEAKRNGWSDIEIIRIYERKQVNDMGVAA
ncbi:hypothetical protein [Escherichia coli]|uniref:hypothetical protein n=1 Tax=Escherichia coli TaxID=562 RepID=UPI002F9632BB